MNQMLRDMLTPEQRPDGWYLDSKRIEVGDVIKIAYHPVNHRETHTWLELVITETAFAPGGALAQLVNHGGIAAWP